MVFIAQTRSAAVLPFCAFLQEHGAPVHRLMSTARLAGDGLRHAESLVPVWPVVRFFDAAVASQGAMHLGLLVGERTPVEQLGAFGRLVRNSLTLFGAIGSSIELIGMWDSSLRIWLEQADSRAWLFRDHLLPPGPGAWQAEQYGLMLTLQLVRLAAGPRWKPAEVHLQMPWHRDVANFEVFSEARMRFGQRASGIAFPRELLWRRLQPLDKSFPSSEADDLAQLQASAPAFDLVGSLQQVLGAHLSSGCMNIERIAEVAGLSVRTLQRQLRAEGMQFSQVVDQVRFERAACLLKDPGIAVKDIAHELGYHNCANFTRAFRRWSGLCPQDFRDWHVGGESTEDSPAPAPAAERTQRMRATFGNYRLRATAGCR